MSLYRSVTDYVLAEMSCHPALKKMQIYKNAAQLFSVNKPIGTIARWARHRIKTGSLELKQRGAKQLANRQDIMALHLASQMYSKAGFPSDVPLLCETV